MAKKGKFKLKGMKKLMKRLDQEVRAIEGRTMKGLIRATILIRRESEPLTPVDLGNLRASWFTVNSTGDSLDSTPSFKGKGKSTMAANHGAVKNAVQANLPKRKKQPAVGFGYTANYASWVHEMTGANFKRPNAEARFLYKAIRRNEDKILEIIRENAEIK